MTAHGPGVSGIRGGLLHDHAQLGVGVSGANANTLP
jgi:hypothetical protein